MGNRGRSKRAMVVLTAVAAPVALGFETLLRKLVLPARFEQVRELLRPLLTPVGWGLAGLAALAGLAGLAWQKRLIERKQAQAGDHDEARQSARLGAFLLAASVPQLPAVFATVSFMFGSALLPVIVAIVVSTAFVCVQAARA